MTVRLKESIRNARLDLVSAAIDAGAAAGKLKFYTGPQPATGAAITTETLLATATFSDPAAPAAAGGVLTFSAISGGNAIADGTAVWARAEDSNGGFVADFDVGLEASGAAIEINSVDMVTGGPVSVNNATLTAGNA